jgi:NADH-ubiquinone oxidoreductase chain 6
MLYIVNEMTFNGYNAINLDLLYIIAILLGILVIISKNPIVSVLFLIGLFLTISAYLILTGLNFIGLSYLLVYIGAVSILFLFVLMLINIRISELFIDSANSIPVVLLQSSPSTFVMKIGIIYISISYSDDLLSFYQTISDTFHIEKSSFGSRPMHPLIREAYDLYLAMQEKSVNIRPLFDQYISRIDFANFSPLSFTRDQLQFHCNLAIANHIQRMILCLLGSFVLILGVNIIYVIDLIVTVVDGFCNFVK